MRFADFTYVVKPGDTLTGIALTLGLCQKGSGNSNADWADCLGAAQRIADANALPDVNRISVGQQLVIPAPPVPAVVQPDGTVAILSANAPKIRWGLVGLTTVFAAFAGYFYTEAHRAIRPRRSR